MEGVSLVVPWVLVPPLAVFFVFGFLGVFLHGLDDDLHLGVAAGPIHLLFFCAFLCQGVSSLVARHVAVGGNPLLARAISTS